jgi:alkanesulfonate monooxygenase SsuD/methylene tetrahydromethanopterin reductase-like flavin-dependent oxidoreductase (luciferase family)
VQWERADVAGEGRSPVRVGLKLNTQFLQGQDAKRSVDELMEQVRAARDAGFDSVWVSQHYLAKPFQMVQTWPLAARLVPEAGGMTIGTSIFLLTLHNPVYAAEHASTLDVLTGGRFIFGVGLGYREEEFEAFGLDVKARASRFTEALDVLLRLWTESGPVTHRGRHFTLTEATLPMRPIQRPHPPIWIAGSNDPAVSRAARYGFPWLINPHASLTTVERQMAMYWRVLREHGHPRPAELPAFKEMSIERSRDKAVEAARPHLEGKYRTYSQWGLDKPMPKSESLSTPFEELSRDRFIIGTPQECLQEIRRHHERVGTDHFLLRLQWPGMPQPHVMRQIELVGTEVIPELRRWAHSPLDKEQSQP